MTHISEFGRRIGVGMVYVERRLEIILHAVGQICLRATRSRFIFTRIGKFLTEITLIDAAIVAYFQDQRGIGRKHRNLRGRRGRQRRKAANDNAIMLVFIYLRILLICRLQMEPPADRWDP